MKKLYHGSKPRSTPETSKPSRDNVLEVFVARRMRQLRLAQNLSMRKVWALGGPCVSTLTMGENAKMALKVSTLGRLAKVLRVPIKAFFSPNECGKIDKIGAFVHGLNEDEFARLRTLLTGESQ